MKKKLFVITLAVIAALTFSSCSKSNEQLPESNRGQKYFIQAVAVDYDGTETYSQIILVK